MTRRNYLLQYPGLMFFILAQTTAFSQVTLRTTAVASPLKNAQPVIGRVLYNFSYMKDTAHRDYYYEEIFELDYTKNSSSFTSYTKKQNDTLMRNQVAAAFKNAPDPNHVAITLAGAPSSADWFYIESSPKPMVCEIKVLAGVSFIIQALQPPIDWNITDSTKTIRGFLCQKATGHSYGRWYTAWFCTDLPHRFGPRRLNGLPGLILEAYDDRMEVIYRLNRVEEQHSVLEPVGLPANAETTTYPAFARAEEAFKRNPQAFIDANRGKRSTVGRTAGIMGDFDASKIKSIDVRKSTSAPKNIKANNPIDLITE
ncbi:GLPGLI family protein [Niabella aurantiaca]|uniref:GLPGLI family protein n=1 Tax=Niabella aurantiaca TaxID=379900 RepID=UPI00036671D1|nr:GLPGLI family protein [Niabella aurantiaca]